MSDPTARAGARAMVSGVFWNALGRGLPLMLALLLTPVLVHQLGLERWGLFTLALALVGVFGVFDFGVGQALTRAVAERIGAGRAEEATGLVAAALATLAGISLVAAAGLWLAVPALVQRLLSVPEALQPQAIAAFRVMALAAPLVVLNAALWGVLAAWQRFRVANLATIPVNIFYYLGPVLVLLVWDSLVGVMLALVACRLANTLSYIWLVRPLLPGFSWRGIRLRLVLPLLKLGGFMTFTGLATQALLYADRFLIGAMLSLSAVAFYATPLDLVLRVWILPVAVAQTLLPAFAGAFLSAPVATAALLRRGALAIMAMVLPAALLLVVAAGPLLTLWLGAEFAAGGARVLQILGVGIFFSCLAFAPNALLEAIGRPDAVALLVLAEAAIFLPLAALLLPVLGIEGAAIAWALRAATDVLAKLLLAARLYRPAAPAALGLAAPLSVAGLGLAALLALPSLPWLLGGGAVVLVAFLLAAYRALPEEDRLALRHPRQLLRLRSA
ncbi:flippase [Siccirubricoccus sp. KC 17139]|uniref:Flippase n=1 Tax=Siccirubricoccus soli TaxID=2899147 RepID=A0ABT1D7D6_9PROT|nr:flippase [Siccirubricoccus soli]MCO6417849.1 flippase [Siccirubricoccus soli]MCP2683984.1 flippase [Siccirubricoccus soli]